MDNWNKIQNISILKKIYIYQKDNKELKEIAGVMEEMEVVEVKEDFKEKFRFLIKKVQKLHLNSNKKLLNKMANKE